MRAWLHPLNAESIRAGRSKPPPVPELFEDEMITRAVNETLRTTRYDVEDIRNAPQDWLERILLLHNALANRSA